MSQTLGQAAQAIVEQAFNGSQTKPSSTLDNEHKRAFAQTFKRWAILFRRKDGNEDDDRWMMAEYYQSLNFLTAEGFDALTDELKRECTFFPSIRECLLITNPGKYNYQARFGGDPAYMPKLFRSTPADLPQALAAPRAALGYGGDE